MRAIVMPPDVLPFLEYAALAAAVIYAFLNAMTVAGLLRPSRTSTTSPETLSVIVAARNEAERVGPLLESLTRQTRQPDEIIVVDDRSTDGTSEVVASYRHRLPMLHVIRVDSLPAGMAPKKHALERGIAASRGTILCFTDADGTVPPDWLSTIGSKFLPEVGVVAGTYVGSNDSGLLGRFISYEKFKSTILASGSIGLGFAWMASGSNLAYRRVVFDEVGGFTGQHASISGDDDLFVQRVRRTTSWSVVAMIEPEATVTTDLPSTWGQFLRQRTRHFSAGKWYDVWSKIWLALYHLSNTVTTASLAAAIFLPASGSFLRAYVIKLCADLVLLAVGEFKLHRPHAWTWFVPLELLNVLYVALAGPAGWLGRVRWKTPEETP